MGGNANNWLTIRLEGTRTNRGGIGARIEVEAGNLKMVREVRAGSSAFSSETPWPTFGLAREESATVRVRWPSGTVDTIADVAACQTITVVEGK